MEAMTRVSRSGLMALTVIVAGGAAYELAVAAGVIRMGSQPGEPPAGNAAVIELTFVALLLMGAVLLAAALRRRRADVPGSGAVPTAGAVATAFLVARFYSYDPYYAPDLRRLSDGGIVAGRWIVFVVGATLAAGILVRRWPRVASAGTAIGVWAIALTAAVAATGH
jgi:MYXO-CTERM domain-containing protein